MIRYSTINLSDLWIGYPALSRDIRRNIAQLQVGDFVTLKQDESRLFLRTFDGQKIGALSSAGSKEWGARLDKIKTVRIHAIVQWRKEYMDDAPDNFPDQWEIPVPEICWTE